MQLKLVIYFIFYVSIEQNLEKKVGIYVIYAEWESKFGTTK